MRGLTLITLIVPDYDEAIAHYTHTLGFTLLEDTPQPGKRWVRLSTGKCGVDVLLARATTPEQTAMIGHQGGGRVWLFLQTDDFASDHARMIKAGIRFEEAPRHEPYGTVAVFNDKYGNRWDLLEPA